MREDTTTDCVYVSDRLVDALSSPKPKLTIWQWICKMFFEFNNGKETN